MGIRDKGHPTIPFNEEPRRLYRRAKMSRSTRMTT
jgi:hypothetical protein